MSLIDLHKKFKMQPRQPPGPARSGRPVATVASGCEAKPSNLERGRAMVLIKP